MVSNAHMQIEYINMHERFYDRIIFQLEGIIEIPVDNRYCGIGIDGLFLPDGSNLNSDPESLKTLSHLVRGYLTLSSDSQQPFQSESANKVYSFINTFENKCNGEDKIKSSHQLIMEKQRSEYLNVQLTECLFNTHDLFIFLRECSERSDGFSRLQSIIQLRFYLTNTVQMKIQMMRVESKGLSVFTVIENIEERLAVANLNGKLNYSQMLICSMSHELYTPIYQLVGATDRLLQIVIKNKNIPEEVKEETKLVSQISHCLTMFVQNTLDFARYINRSLSLTPEFFHLRPCIDRVMGMFSIKAKKSNIKLEMSCPDDIVLFTDKDKVMGLLFIFLENSMKYIQKGRISVRVLPGKSQNMSDECIVFEIRDTGLGIEQIELEKIEEILNNPFSDLRASGAAGIGIGFRVAQILLMHLLKGDICIEVKSQRGEGTLISYAILKSISDPCESERKSFLQTQKSLSKLKTQNKNEKEFIRKISSLRQLEHQKHLDSNSLSKEISPSQRPLLEKGEDSKNSPGTPSKTREEVVILEQPESLDSQKGEADDFPIDKTSTPLQPPVMSTPQLLAKVNKHRFGSTSPMLRLHSISRGRNQKTVIELQPMQTLDGRGAAHDGSNLDNNLSHYSRKLSSKIKKANSTNEQEEQSIPRVAIVVDDEVLNAEFLQGWLESLGFVVHTAIGGELVLDLCEKLMTYNVKVDVIFMDYSMPEMNGDECTRRLRQMRFDPILHDTKIIGLTAHKDAAVTVKCKEAGMDLVCYKPFTYKDTLEVLVRLGVITSVLDMRSPSINLG
jgi:CheY-like chemotaxis protein/signal transduction histidine kinase